MAHVLIDAVEDLRAQLLEDIALTTAEKIALEDNLFRWNKDLRCAHSGKNIHFETDGICRYILGLLIGAALAGIDGYAIGMKMFALIRMAWSFL